MKKLLLSAVAFTALAVGPALAADLGRRPVYKAPPPPPPPVAYNWTGCYVGGYAGGGWSNSDGATFTDLGQNGLGAAGSTRVLLSCLIRAALPRRGSYRNIHGAPTWTAVSSAAAHSAAIGSPSARPSCSAWKAKAATCI